MRGKAAPLSSQREHLHWDHWKELSRLFFPDTSLLTSGFLENLRNLARDVRFQNYRCTLLWIQVDSSGFDGLRKSWWIPLISLPYFSQFLPKFRLKRHEYKWQSSSVLDNHKSSSSFSTWERLLWDIDADWSNLEESALCFIQILKLTIHSPFMAPLLFKLFSVTKNWFVPQIVTIKLNEKSAIISVNLTVTL